MHGERGFYASVMIKSEFGYQQTLDAIKLMESSIEHLRRRWLPDNPKFFALLAEGPEEEIIRLQAEADEYLYLQRKAS